MDLHSCLFLANLSTPLCSGLRHVISKYRSCTLYSVSLEHLFSLLFRTSNHSQVPQLSIYTLNTSAIIVESSASATSQLKLFSKPQQSSLLLSILSSSIFCRTTSRPPLASYPCCPWWTIPRIHISVLTIHNTSVFIWFLCWYWNTSGLLGAWWMLA